MEKRENISLFEKDNSFEINNCDITIEQLKSAGVPMSVLSAETYLRKFYGDVIYSVNGEDGEEDASNKKVQKLGEEDMTIDKNYKQICEDIENSEFDKSLDEIMS